MQCRTCGALYGTGFWSGPCPGPNPKVTYHEIFVDGQHPTPGPHNGLGAKLRLIPGNEPKDA
jgi:hypothetical protein